MNRQQQQQQCQQQQQQQQRSSSATSGSIGGGGFLPEPFPTASGIGTGGTGGGLSSSNSCNPKAHFHDAFGDNDSGVDYGPPNEFECDDDDDDDDEEDEGGVGLRDAAMVQGMTTAGAGDDAAVATSRTGDEGGILLYNDQNNNQRGEIISYFASVENNSTIGNNSTFASGGAASASSINNNNNDSNDNNTNNNDDNTTARIEELEEEIILHETTLESLTSKLQALNNEIQLEENHSSSLSSDLLLLNQRKVIFRKRTDNNMRLVKELEESLERCLERLRSALDGLAEEQVEVLEEGGGTTGEEVESEQIGEEEVMVDLSADVNASVIQEAVDMEAMHQSSVCSEGAGPLENEVVSITAIHSKNKEKVTQDVVSQTINSNNNTHQKAEQEYTYLDIPLHNQTDYKITWPTPKLVRKIHRETLSLPCDMPTWRTHPLSMPLLGGGMSNKELIVKVMNVMVLEKLLEREEELCQKHNTNNVGRVVGNNLSENGCGWTKESDLWGTSLDVCAHVNWKHLFAGYRRVDEGLKGMMHQQQQPLDSKNDNDDNGGRCGIDPNVILCPYELGGTCADDQCPYQHFQKDGKSGSSGGGDGNKKNMGLEGEDGRYMGYVRYNNFPKPKLPRPFVRDDFIIATKKKKNAISSFREQSSVIGGLPKEERMQGLPTSASNEGSKETEPNTLNNGSNVVGQDQQMDNRRFHCPVCLDENTFNREELRDHMKLCNRGSLMVDGKRVTVHHVLRTPEDGDGLDQVAFRGSVTSDDVHHGHGSNSDPTLDKHAGLSEQKNDPEEEYAASRTSQQHEHPPSDVDDHSMGAEHDDDYDDGPSAVEENLDYVSLPSVAETSDEDDNEQQRADSSHLDDTNTVFGDILWWQQIDSYPFALSPEVIEGCQSTFDSLLLAFGFQRLCTKAEAGKGQYSLRCIMRKVPAEGDTSSTREKIMEDALLFARLIDLSRILIHMGRDTFPLEAIRSICQSRTNHPYNTLLEGISNFLVSLSHSRYSFAIFQVQVHLLVVSEFLRTHYDSLCDGTNSKWFCKDTFLDQISHLNRTEMFVEKNLVPAGFDALSQSLMSSIPSTDRGSSDREDIWASFVKTLRLLMEKFVVIPLFQIETNQQLSLLLHSVCIGKFLGHLIRTASREHTFVSYLHALEPIWGSLQPLLQSTAWQWKGWLGPDIVAIVIIGPVIFSCAADSVAPPGNGAVPSQKLPPRFDARAHANVSSLDNFIVGIIKDLNRFSRRSNGRFIEPLMAPIHALSATISVALGSFEKARLRLEHALNMEVESRQLPSIYSLSEMIWSQLVQIYATCPSYASPLERAKNTAGGFIKPSLPIDMLQTHHEIAARIVDNGIYLWGVKLRGDSHMNIITPSFNTIHCKEWEKVGLHILSEQPLNDTDVIEVALGPSTIEFCISNPYPELDGVKGRSGVFPESLLLLSSTLTKLSLNKCGLERLPFSIGHHLPNLKLLDLSNNCLTGLPSSICFMTYLEVINLSYNHLKRFPEQLSQCSNLRVIDVSHNQLENFPADLALQCHNLQAFIVDGNPAAASETISPPQKRQKLSENVDSR